MPTAALHSHYWDGVGVSAPAATSTVISYPLWQTTINVHSVAGSLGANVLQGLYEHWRPSATTTQVKG